MSTDRAIIDEWQQIFATAAGADGRLSKDEFVALLGVRDAFLAGRLFARFDADGKGDVDRDEFIGALEKLTGASEDDKLRFAFDLHDLDASGTIDRKELAEFLCANLRENRLEFSPGQIEDLVERFFTQSDSDGSGDISFEEFKTAFARYPGLLQSLAVSPLAWLRPKKPVETKAIAKAPSIGRTLSNKLAVVLVLAVYGVANTLLCRDAVLRYASAGLWIQIARGSAAIVYLNGALVFLPMMRNLLTRLRRSRVGRALPFDESVAFHRLCGHVMFAAGGVHTVAHLINRPAVLWTDAGRSGLVLLVVFAAMWVTALAIVRKRGHFRLFFLTHFAYIAWVALALVHGPRFWRWLLGPLCIFVVDQLWRMRRASMVVRVISGELLPSDVLALKLEKPSGFSHHAGGYVYFKCPEVSAFEWHPFTISSAPEEETLSLHIRAVGSWTGALYRLIKAGPKRVTAQLDGPFGAPAQDIFSCKRAVLIGAGIGVTPFASVLRSILARKQKGDPALGLEKVRFFWLSREQRSFEWFLQLLTEIEKDASGLFEINVYLTGAESRHDLKAATLFIAMDMLHAKTNVDLITGLHSQTHTGRPDWSAIFDRIVSEDGAERSTVFFCGPPGLGRDLKTICGRRGLDFRQEVF